jgi:peptide/nickel transport system substrate-binding protein
MHSIRLHMNRLARSVAALLIVALASATLAQAASDKTLRAVVNADLKIIYPTWSTAYVTIRHGYLVYDTLFALNSKYEPKPQMVDTYSISPDGLVYEFKLRAGMKWHDGAPVTAADCVASLKRWAIRNAMGQQITKSLDTYEIVDPLTFRMKLKQPFGLVLEALGGAEQPAFMMPQRIAETPADKQITDPTGSGPFIFKKDEWKPGNKTVYVRNPDYIPRKEPADYLSGGKVAKLDRVEWLYINDANTTLAALQAGEIDYFEAPPLEFVELMQKDPNIVVKKIDKLGVTLLLRPNSLFPPFNNYKARQALLYLINQDEIMQAVVGNPDLYLKFCATYFMCNSSNATEAGADALKGGVNIAKAKELLKEGGYKGEPVTVLFPTDRAQYGAATTVIIEALRKAGVNVDIQSLDWATITARRNKKDVPEKGGWNLFVTSMGGPDVSGPLSNIWFVSPCAGANVGWACDDDLTKMIETYSREPDAAKRHAMIDDIQKRAFVSVPYGPLGQFFQPIAFRSNIKGVLDSGVPVYWNIEKQ